MLKDLIFNYYKKYYKDTLGLPNWEKLTHSRLTEEKAESKRVALLEEKIGTLQGKTLLNVGCGTGGFNIVATQRGAAAYGIDANNEAIRICRFKAEKHGIPSERFQVSTAENLPFKEDFFDIINCFTVLEHVLDVKKSLLEMIRVSKPGGKIYVNSPHYWRLYEKHYKIFWCPLFLIRPIGKFYLFLRNRPTKFLETLNFLSNKTIRDALKKEKIHITFLKEKIEKGHGIMGIIAYSYHKIFGIDSNIEFIITKKAPIIHI